MTQMVKNLSAMQETWVRSLGRDDLLEKGMAIHSSILAWKIPWTESLVGYSPWDHKELDMTERLVKKKYRKSLPPVIQSSISSLNALPY